MFECTCNTQYRSVPEPIQRGWHGAPRDSSAVISVCSVRAYLIKVKWLTGRRRMISIGNVRTDLTVTRVRVIITAIEKHEVLHILCVCLRPQVLYLACNAHATYYIATCGLSGSIIFFYIISQTAQLWAIRHLTKCACLDFLYKPVRNTSHSETNLARYY